MRKFNNPQIQPEQKKPKLGVEAGGERPLRDQMTMTPKASGQDGYPMELKSIVEEIETKLLDAARRRFTGEIRLTFNVSQGGFSTSYIEKERENLIRKRG